MKDLFGHFSEKEIEEISSILEEHGVSFEVDLDEGVHRDIGESMRNNLRYLHGATVCNDMLTIKASRAELAKIPLEDQKKLNDLRLFWEEETFEGEEFDVPGKSAPQKFINSQEPRRNGAIGIFYLLSILFALVLMAVNYLSD